MSYSKYLKTLFQEVSLDVEDLFLLESFQIKYLPDRIPKEEFSILLYANPIIHRYFINIYPPISGFINKIMIEHPSNKNNKTVEENCQNLLWEVADLIIYNKYPEVYHKKVKLDWELSEIITENSLDGKVVLDIGAGTGRLSFLNLKFAKTIYAVEPVRSFRHFIKEKVNRENVKNLFVVDGFLDSIPFPDNSVDVLMTSNAIGWNLENELVEIERVLRSNGKAIHLMKINKVFNENSLHDTLISPIWKYTCKNIHVTKGMKLRYSKTIN